MEQLKVLDITDVCYTVGFKNLSHFSKVFKEKYGMPPTALAIA